MNLPNKSLAKKFSNKEYRHGYADDFLNTFIAAQIKALRDQRGWTQAELAQRAGMKQSRISAMENVNNAGWNVRTLARLAEAFDVSLAVIFKSFGERLRDIEGFQPSALRVPSYRDDPALSQIITGSGDTTFPSGHIRVGGLTHGTSSVPLGAPEVEGELPESLAADDHDEEFVAA